MPDRTAGDSDGNGDQTRPGATGDETTGGVSKPSLTRREWLGAAGAALVGSVSAGAAGATTTTVNLGDEGLSEGDDISPYLDQYWESGTEVVVPQGNYQLTDNDAIGFSGSDAVLRGDGVVELYAAQEMTNPSIAATGGTVRIEGITVRNDPSLGGIDIDVQNGATLEFVDFNLPDGQLTRSEMYPTFLNRADADGTVKWIDCYFQDHGDNCIYTGQSPNCHNVIEGCTLVSNNIDQVRVGGDNDVVRNNEILMPELPPEDDGGNITGRGVRVRFDGDVLIENNRFVYDVEVSDPIVVVGDGNVEIRDNEIDTVTDEAMYRVGDSSSTVTGGGNVLTGPTTTVTRLPYDELVSCPETEGGDGSTCTSGSSGFSVSTLGTTSVGDTTATLEGSVGDLGGASSADAGFEYREAGASSWTATATETLSSTGSYTRTVEGLDGGTDYEFRAAAEASDGDADTGTTDTFATEFDHHLVVRPTVDAAIDYTFTTTGLAEFGPEAESKNDSVTQNADGTYTVTGYVTYDYTDDYYYNGDVTDWSATKAPDAASGEYELVLDGSVVTPEELTVDSAVAVTTGSATDVSGSSATLNGSLDDLGGADSATVGFEYRESGTDAWTATATETLSAAGDFAATVDGLSGGTNYEFRAVAEASDGDAEAGTTGSFSTGYDHRLVIRPTVDAAIDYTFTATGETVFGPEAEAKNDSVTENADGTHTVTGYVQYDFTDDYLFNGSVTEWSATRNPDWPSGEYELVLDGSVVTPDELTGDTDPQATTGSASGVTADSATLSGSVDDLGGADSADVAFDYRPVGAGDFATASAGTVSSTGTVDTTVDGLLPGTDYEFRIRAAASDGETATGDLVGFATADRSPPAVDRFQVQEEGSPNPHADITADWVVSDPDADLVSVLVEVFDAGGSRVDAAETAVGGGETYDLDYFRIKNVDGQSFDVRLTVTDAAGLETTATRTVTE